MSDLLNRIGDICFKIPDAIQSAFDKLRGKENINYPDNRQCLCGVAVIAKRVWGEVRNLVGIGKKQT